MHIPCLPMYYTSIHTALYTSVQYMYAAKQGCGSALIFCRSGSSFFSQCKSGSSLYKYVKYYLMKSFLELSNTKKLSKYKKYGACLIDCKKCNKSQLSPIFLHFPDPGGKMIADPCVSGSTALQQGILKQ